MQILNVWLKKISGSKNNPEKSYTAKVSEHMSCDYSMFTICEFDDTKNEHVYRGKDCMKMFSESLKEHAMETILKKRKWCH